MSSLRSFLATSIDVSDETLILLRLMGRPFGQPFNIDLGEGPDDALCCYLRDSASATASVPFLNLVGMLLDPAFPPNSTEPDPVENLFRELEEGDRAAFAFQLVKLIENAGVAVDSDTLRALSRKFAPGPQIAGPALSAFWHLLLSHYSASIVSDDEISVSRKTILDPAFINGPVIATARQRPNLFFGTIVPILFEAMRVGDTSARSLPALPFAMRAGLISLYRDLKPGARRQSHLRLFAGQLEELQASGEGGFAIEATLDGAARATSRVRLSEGCKSNACVMPFSDLALLEAGSSRGRARAQQMSDESNEVLDKILEKYVAPIRNTIGWSMGNKVDPVVATNFIPYFEGIYLRIWQSLLQRAGMKIEMKEHDWGEVVPKLFSGQLSFAIWNDHVAPDILRKKPEIYRTNRPLLEYNYYPLVFRRDALESILAASLPKVQIDALISALTRGKQISPELFVTFVELRGALRMLDIGLVGNSDIEEIARQALGKEFMGRSMQSDIAVELLVNGEMDGAFLGGIQAAYLARRFGHAMIILTELNSPTPMHLWFDAKNYVERGYPNMVRPLLRAWKATSEIWKRAESARNNSTDRKHLQDWILSLASELNYGVSGLEWGMRTPISSWEMIAQLSAHHSALMSPDALVLNKPRTEAELHNNPDGGGVKRINVSALAVVGGTEHSLLGPRTADPPKPSRRQRKSA